jgi:hypothetical protein
MERRRAERREMALVSPRATQQAEALARAIAAVERLRDRRRVLSELADELPQRLVTLQTAEATDNLRSSIETLTHELDHAVTQAAAALDPLSFKLGRTRRRGVYRSGRLLVVPFVDELGAERRREFATISEAHEFRLALRISEKAKKQLAGEDTRGWDLHG